MQKVVDGLLVNYEILGRGGKNMVIMHGWGGSLHDWLPTAHHLKDKYKILLFDFPGLGGSARPKDDWDIYQYANFTSNFIFSLGFRKSIILGHSFGGRVGLILAARYENLVEKLILVDAAGMEIKSFKAWILGSAFRLPFAFSKLLIPRRVKYALGSHDYRQAGQMRGIFVKVVGQNLRLELPKITRPTLILWGEKDKVLLLKEARMIQSGVTQSRLRIVWGASHWPHREKPEDFRRILSEEGI